MDILTNIPYDSAISGREVEAVLMAIAPIVLRPSLSVDFQTHV